MNNVSTTTQNTPGIIYRKRYFEAGLGYEGYLHLTNDRKKKLKVLEKHDDIHELVNSIDYLVSEVSKTQTELDRLAAAFTTPFELENENHNNQCSEGTVSVGDQQESSLILDAGGHGVKTAVNARNSCDNNTNTKQHSRDETLYEYGSTDLSDCYCNKDEKCAAIAGNLNVDSWNENYKQLVAYKKRYGHINLAVSKEYSSLLNWVNNNRKYMRRESHLQAFPELKKDRMEKLKRIGVNLSKRNYDEQWENNYENLKNFIVEYGRLPKRRENKLAQWLHNQRKHLKSNSKEEDPRIIKIRRLINHTSTESSNKSMKFWMNNFNLVKLFISEHDGKLPTKKDGDIGHWLLNQRHKCLKVPKRNESEEKRRMEKIRLLKAIGASVVYEEKTSSSY